MEKSFVKGVDYVGRIAGYIAVSDLSNCHNNATVIGNNYVGGIMGGNGSTMFGGNVKSCYNRGKISGEQYIGGIIGNSETTYISCCYNIGTVSGTERVGGIAGRSTNASYCWNTGEITGTTHIGGILGEGAYYGSSSTSLTNSFNAGIVSGKSYVGGVLGYSGVYSGFYPSNISACYNIGSVIGNGDCVAGIAGYADCGIITNCYNAGNCSFDVTFSGSNGGAAWIQDTDGYNSGYPILSGVDYILYKKYVVSGENMGTSHIVALSPECGYQYNDLTHLTCVITYDQNIKNISDDCYVSLVEYDSDKVIEKYNLKSAIDDTKGYAWIKDNTLVFIFNLNWAKNGTMLSADTKYCIFLDDGTVELADGTILDGISDKNFWSFNTLPIEHFLIKNSEATKGIKEQGGIDLSIYKIMLRKEQPA